MSLITWSPTDKGTKVVLSNNNLTTTITHASGGVQTRVRANLGKSSGKWYWEIQINTNNYSPLIGVAQSNLAHSFDGYSTSSQRVYYAKNGNKFSTVNSAYGQVYGNVGDTIGVILDLDLGTIEFTKNGISQGIAFNDLKTMSYPLFPYLYSGDSGTWTATANFGATEFQYPIPEGYQPYDIENAKWFTTKTKHLIKSSNKIHILSEGTLQEVPVDPNNLTQQDFETYGMKEVPLNLSVLSNLNFEVLKWTDSKEDEATAYTLKSNAKEVVQTTPKNNFNTKNRKGIKRILVKDNSHEAKDIEITDNMKFEKDLGDGKLYSYTVVGAKFVKNIRTV